MVIVKVIENNIININVKNQNIVHIYQKQNNIINIKVNGNMIVQDKDFPNYSGSYEVKPKAFNNTILNTKDKALLKDINVLEIPYFETSNKDGNTVYIGTEMEIR